MSSLPWVGTDHHSHHHRHHRHLHRRRASLSLLLSRPPLECLSPLPACLNSLANPLGPSLTLTLTLTLTFTTANCPPLPAPSPSSLPLIFPLPHQTLFTFQGFDHPQESQHHSLSNIHHHPIPCTFVSTLPLLYPKPTSILLQCDCCTSLFIHKAWLASSSRLSVSSRRLVSACSSCPCTRP